MSIHFNITYMQSMASFSFQKGQRCTEEKDFDLYVNKKISGRMANPRFEKIPSLRVPRVLKIYPSELISFTFLLTGNLQLKDDNPRTVPFIHPTDLPGRSGGIYGNIPRNVYSCFIFLCTFCLHFCILLN